MQSDLESILTVFHIVENLTLQPGLDFLQTVVYVKGSVCSLVLGYSIKKYRRALMQQFLLEFIRISPRRLPRCHLTGKMQKAAAGDRASLAAAPSLRLDGRPSKASTRNTGSNGEAFPL